MKEEIKSCAQVDSAGLSQAAPDPEPKPNDQLQVVLVGPYSAGKTSLIKRCLTEWGTPVPQELAVGAEPTTFESLVVDSRVTFVDTPGTGNDRPAHTRRALEQSVDADLVLAVLTPQLMSAADPIMWSLFDSTAWSPYPRPVAPESLRVVVNRFDESGANAVEDPAGYQARVQLKCTELEDNFAARVPSLGVPRMHVVAADPGAMVFTDIPDSPDDYAGGPWDGIEELLSDLVGAGADLPQLRAKRAMRVRGRQLLAHSAEITRRKPELRVAVSAAKKDRHDLQAHLAELQRLRDSSAADLDARLERAVGADVNATAAPDRESLVRGRVTEAIASWSQGVVDSLHGLVEGAPSGLTTSEPPLVEAIRMSDVHDRSDSDTSSSAWDVARALTANADAVRETARACREFLNASQKLKPAANYIGSEVIELGLQSLSFTLSLSGQSDVENARARQAAKLRLAFVEAAQLAANETAAPLWDWVTEYASGLTGHDVALADALEAAQSEQRRADHRQQQIDHLLESMPT